MTIGEFSAITGISVYTLRYYEKKGLLRVSRDSAGRRDYSADDIEWVKFIRRLKDTGMILRDIRHYSDLRYQGDDTMAERMELLVRHRKIEKCLFQSPIVDMEYLIRQMFLWFQVTEERLCVEKEIPTPVDTLRWDYYQYVREHPVCDWRIPTAILYGGKDNMQPAEVIRNFAQRYSCDLTIAQDSEHAFMQDGDKSIVEK